MKSVSRRVLAGLCGVVLLPALATGPARAATAPTIAAVWVAGFGAGDLVRTTGTGFTPGVSVEVGLVEPSATEPLLTTTADSSGTVTLPADARLPATLAAGRYRLTMVQTGGVSATSREFGIVDPKAYLPYSIVPGSPARLGYTEIHLVGLTSSPEAHRSVTVDDQLVDSQWSSDSGAFADPNIAFAPPADLAVGPHQLTFNQTGPTPYTISGTVDVMAPRIVNLAAHLAPLPTVPMTLASTGWNDVFDVTIVGAAGDRHTGMQWATYHLPDAVGSERFDSGVSPGRLSVGTATITAVSRNNGATATATFVVDPSTLTAPGTLAPGQRLVATDGTVELDMQSDGNLVQRYGQVTQWNSRTVGHPGAYLVVQDDGNVVIRAVDGRALWSTGTAGIGAGVRLAINAADVPTVVTATGRTAWSTFQPRLNGAVEKLSANGYLFRGESLTSSYYSAPERSVLLTVQDSGNVVVTVYGRPSAWSTHTTGHGNDYLILQSDGNLVVRAPNGATLWANGVRGVAGARLVAQSDGNVVEYAPNGKALWSTRTHVS